MNVAQRIEMTAGSSRGSNSQAGRHTQAAKKTARVLVKTFLSGCGRWLDMGES